MSEVKKPEPMFPVDLEGAPKIVLAGKEFAVVPPAIAQAKKIVPALMSLGPRLLSIVAAAETKDSAAVMTAMATIDEAMFDKIADVVYYGILRANPGLSRGEFDQIPATLFELVGALPTVFEQTGFVKAPEPGDAPKGEAQAGQQT